MEIKSEKNRLREEYKIKRANIEPSEKRILDTKICERFLSLASFRFADTLLMYYPLESEVDVTPIAKAALALGKKVAYPKCDSKNLTMDFYFVGSTDKLISGTYGIKEPSEDNPVYAIKNENIHNTTICLIPAVLYDKKGFRIGYGKGYYDRYLSRFKGAKAGIVYSDFIIDNLPHGRYDLAVDYILSERGVTIIK